MLLFLYITIAIIATLIILILLSDIRIIINNYEYTNKPELRKEKYEIKLALYFLGKIKWIQLKLNNKKLKGFSKKDLSERITKIKQNNKKLTKSQRKNQNGIIKNIINEIIKNGKFKTLKLYMLVGVEDVVITSYLVGIISILVPNLIRKSIDSFSTDKHSFKIVPIYQNTNIIYIKLNCIFSIKVVHIINMFKNIKLGKGKYTNFN